jgi:O-antigen/teichoic acid export membrane protein
MLRKIKKIAKEKNVSSLTTSLVVAALGLFSFMLLTRHLPKEQFGEWVLYITLATFIDSLRFGLTSTSLVRLLAGAPKNDYNKLMASSFRINLWVLAIITLVCWLLYALILIFNIDINNGYRLFLLWYPLLGIANLGWKNASALHQAEQNFMRMMYVRLTNVGLFFIFLIFNNVFLKWGLLPILLMNISVNFISSFWCALKKWDGMLYYKQADKAVEKELIAFGKYSMGTLVGSSLLRSADTFIIGLSPVLGSAGIAMYAIPLKLTDLLAIPLRSFSMTAYPKMSKQFLNKDFEGLNKTFYIYSGAVSLLFIPVALFCFIFAEELILFLGGKEYADQLAELTIVFKIFTLYTILLPIDRFTGVFLDSINKPKINLQKVLWMTLANVVFDVIGVFVFESLIVVAIGTVLFTILGIGIGFYFLKKEVQIESKYLWTESMLFFRNLNSHFAK